MSSVLPCTSLPAAPTPAASRRRRGARNAVLALAVSAALAVGSGAGPVAGPAAQAAEPAKSGILLGVVGDVAGAQKRTGQALAVHRYGKFEGNVPKGRMLSVRTSASWKATAAAQPGSALYKNIARWADTIKTRSGKVYVAFHHEPEITAELKFGDAAQFKAAYRRVVEIFRARGASNVIHTWQMTDWAFRAQPADRVAAARWYPGNAYVDVVGGDVYNWHKCGHGQGRWMSLKSLMDPIIAFAKARGKQAALPEFATVRDSRRAGWLSDAHQYLANHDKDVAAVFYFHRPPTNKANAECTWPLSTNAEFTAVAKMAAKATFTP